MADIINALASPEAQIEQQALQRQRKIAEYLQKESLTPMQGQMVSGHYVAPSATQYLAKLAQGLMGSSQQKSLDERESKLAAAIRDERTNTMQQYAELLTGKPAVAASFEEVAPLPGMVYGNGEPIESEIKATPEQAAVAPDRRGAMMLLMKSNDPSMQKFGMQQILADMKAPASNFGKIDPKDYTQDSIAKYAATGNPAVLVAARKRENINGVWQDPYAQAENAVAPSDPNKPFATGPDGKAVPNTAYQQYELGKAKAGKTDISVKTDVKMNEGLAGQVGPMMKDSSIAATGAVQQVDAAQRIIKAIDSDKVFAGPTANMRLFGAQIADTLGVGGKDTAEKIANTRSAIRGFAELTLQGRKSMRGEGAITESEGKLAEKAMSGDIDSMTAAEIKQMAKATERVARFNHAEHQRKIGQMGKTPGLEGVTPFYAVPPIPAPMADVPIGKPGKASAWSIQEVK